jgi:tetratricopeptide (TPR) repeat protein
MGALLAEQGEWAAARVEFEAAIDLKQKLADQFPAVPAYRADLGTALLNLGNLVREGGDPAASLAWFDRAFAHLAPVCDWDPQYVVARLALRGCHMGRAQAYHRLRKYRNALPDWDRAVELSPLPEKLTLRASRANSQVQAGQVAEAVAQVTELTTVSDWTASQWYEFACVYAVASGKVADKKPEYADRAMELLQKAVKAGYKDADHMAKDSDLDPLRTRPDFQSLLESLPKAK